jgi:hypothetical protein
MEAAAQALWVVAGVLRDREMSHTASTVSDLAEMLSCAVDDDA